MESLAASAALDHEDLELDFVFNTASPNKVCSRCQRAYRQHPMDTSKLSQNGRPFLQLLCSGRRVHLVSTETT